MPMIACKACGGPVSSNAKACPKCGQPPPIEAFASSCAGMVVGTVALLLILFVGFCLAVWLGWIQLSR